MYLRLINQSFCTFNAGEVVAVVVVTGCFLIVWFNELFESIVLGRSFWCLDSFYLSRSGAFFCENRNANIYYLLVFDCLWNICVHEYLDPLLKLHQQSQLPRSNDRPGTL